MTDDSDSDGSPSPTPLPPSGTGQVVEGAESPVCCWQGHSSLEVFILDLGPEPWAEPGQNKWCTEREWEVIGINSSVTVSRRGLGLVTQRRGAGSHHAVAENVRDHYPKETE